MMRLKIWLDDELYVELDALTMPTDPSEFEATSELFFTKMNSTGDRTQKDWTNKTLTPSELKPIVFAMGQLRTAHASL